MVGRWFCLFSLRFRLDWFVWFACRCVPVPVGFLVCWCYGCFFVVSVTCELVRGWFGSGVVSGGGCWFSRWFVDVVRVCGTITACLWVCVLRFCCACLVCFLLVFGRVAWFVAV